MNRIAVLYATREGHTARIAQRIATDLRIRGFDVDEHDLRNELLEPDLDDYGAAILAGSVHLGHHEKELVRFVQENIERLERMPNAFLSVTLSEAGAEMEDKPAEERARFAHDVQEVIDRFIRETGWHPAHVKPVAGAIRYTRYNILVRLILKSIAKRAGAPTDTTRDYVFTDWLDLDRFAEELADEISGSCARAAGIPPTATASG